MTSKTTGIAITEIAKIGISLGDSDGDGSNNDNTSGCSSNDEEVRC